MVGSAFGASLTPKDLIPQFKDEEEQSEEAKRKAEEREAALRAADQKAFFAGLVAAFPKKNA